MSAQQPLEVSVSTKGTWRVATIRGDLDMATAKHLEAACESDVDDLALVMTGVRFIDSSGLRALFEINKAHDNLVLVKPSAVVKRLLSLTEMTDVFAVTDDLSTLG